MARPITIPPANPINVPLKTPKPNILKLHKSGERERIRTSDLLLRRQLLYPAELRVQSFDYYLLLKNN